MQNNKLKLIETVLTNDETSTDQELIEYFETELKINHRQATNLVLRRYEYLNKIEKE